MALLSTSGLVLLVCVLAGLYLVNRRVKPEGTVAIGAERYAADVMEEPERKDMTSDTDSSTQGLDTLPVRSESSGFVPRRGRVLIFGLASLTLLIALVTGIISWLDSASFVLPLACTLIGAGLLTFLRVLAIRDRDRRRALTALAVEKNQKAHMPVASRKHESLINTSKQAETSSLELRPAPGRPARARQQMPVSHAAKALRKARTHSPALRRPIISVDSTTDTDSEIRPRLRMDEALPDTSWQLTEVPRPTYLDAPIAHRDIPATEPEAPEHLSQTKTLAEAASLNLDDVLNRRRA